MAQSMQNDATDMTRSMQADATGTTRSMQADATGTAQSRADKKQSLQTNVENIAQYKQDFIDFMIESDALKFGGFTLKSGRQSPFFMNTGAYTTGEELHKLGIAYAKAIESNFGLDFDVVFGPAYKGIPLAVITSMALFELYGKNVEYCSNRKEIKDHGEGGALLGASLESGGRVLIVEDVTTSGKSIEETYPILMSYENIEVIGLMVSLDREEVGASGKSSALSEVSNQYGIKTASIVTMSEVVKYLHGSVIDDAQKAEIDAYYAKYGAK